MIYALEGCDRAGKTTLYNRVLPNLPKSMKLVPTMPSTPELWGVMPYVELRQAALWEALYDSRMDYFCDRHVAVSSPVYGRLHGRQELVDWRAWILRVHVLFLSVPVEELQRRHAVAGDPLMPVEKYGRLQQCYAEVLSEFRFTVIDGTKSLEEQANEVVRIAWGMAR